VVALLAMAFRHYRGGTVPGWIRPLMVGRPRAAVG